MPQVDMVATASFSYKTRRLMPGDQFQAKNEAEAKILEGIKKARLNRIVEPPPAKVAKKIATATKRRKTAKKKG